MQADSWSWGLRNGGGGERWLRVRGMEVRMADIRVI